MIRVKDKGVPPNSAECDLVVRLFSNQEIVQLVLLSPAEDIAAQQAVFEAILADILKVNGIEDLYVVKITAINST